MIIIIISIIFKIIIIIIDTIVIVIIVVIPRTSTGIVITSSAPLSSLTADLYPDSFYHGPTSMLFQIFLTDNISSHPL